MTNFCTLYNSNYAAKGLAMYHSLAKHCPSFHLYLFAFDDRLAIAMKQMALKHLTVITLKEFEDPELLSIKHTRTAGEYCWTCSGSTILYCLEHFHLDACTYIDADLCFFSDPSVLIDEMGSDDVLITAHRYTPKYDQTKTSGKYCVQFMTFKNTENGLHVLRWWRNACLEWCFNRQEDGKFGDQKYLDDWTTRFKGIHELQHLGGGVAPWNMQQYHFHRKDGVLMGTEIATGKEFPVIFFHFHSLRCYVKGIVREFELTDLMYAFTRNVRHYLYDSYLPLLKRSHREMYLLDQSIDGVAPQPSPKRNMKSWVWHIFRHALRSQRQYYNIWLCRQ
jgi:hypothetical protein